MLDPHGTCATCRLDHNLHDPTTRTTDTHPPHTQTTGITLNGETSMNGESTTIEVILSSAMITISMSEEPAATNTALPPQIVPATPVLEKTIILKMLRGRHLLLCIDDLNISV